MRPKFLRFRFGRGVGGWGLGFFPSGGSLVWDFPYLNKHDSLLQLKANKIKIYSLVQGYFEFLSSHKHL